MEGAALAFGTLCLCLAIIFIFVSLFLSSEEGISLKAKLPRAAVVLMGMYGLCCSAYILMTF